MSNRPPDGFRSSEPPFLHPTAFVIGDENGASSVVDRATLPPISRKTRELPKLTECHSCGFRINASNGQEKLRRLNSEWRIVLLCGKCYVRCVRGELCTYCLAEFSREAAERFECGECCCFVHKDCVCKFSEFPPWSYLDWRASSVCLDCWLPSKVRKLRDVKRKIGNSACGGKKSLIERGWRDAVEKRAQLVVKPRMVLKDEEFLSEAMVLKGGGLGKENGGFCFVADGGLGQKGKGVDDAELAVQLHRVMNSSPRILSSPKSSSSSLVDTLKRQPRVGRNISVEKSSLVHGDNVNREGYNLLVSNGFDYKDEGGEGTLKEGQGSCSNNSMYSNSFLWKELDLPIPELKFTYVSRKSLSNVDKRPGRYMFKYSRKRSRLRELVTRKYTYLYDRSTNEVEASSSVIIPPSSSDPTNFPDSYVLASPVSMCANGSLENNGQQG